MPSLVVDAANVVGARPDGWWRDRAAAARRLVDGVRRLADAGGADAVGSVVVVLEGVARAAAAPGVDGLVTVVHAEASGDDAVVAAVADLLPGPDVGAIRVVTADRGLRERVQDLGATTVGPGWLWRRLDGPTVP